MVEFDILRGSEYDLSKQDVWDSIFAQVGAGNFDVIILSPPCGTFSRARFHFAGMNGPRPLRTRAHLRGFPWLRNSDLQTTTLANFFVDKCIALADLQASGGKFFLFEHPEQLGLVPSGEVPGSVWDFPAMRSLVEGRQAATWPLHQCFFGAETAKPTRLASNLPGALQYGQCWHVLAADGSYLGPLQHCPHEHGGPLLGREANAWRTAASAAYPALFCDFLARMIFSALDEPRQVGQGLDSNFLHPAEALAEALLHSTQAPLPADVAAVFSLLPRTKAHAATGDETQGSAFFAGANWESAGLVLRMNTWNFPQSCSLVCRFISALSASHHFGAFVILDNVLSAPHRDGKNAHSPNLVVALSRFQGGQIWHEDSSGDVERAVHGRMLRGRLLPLQDGPVQVFARDKFHQTEPWSGQRIVLIAYLPENTHFLQPAESQYLQSLGFKLPGPPLGGDAWLGPVFSPQGDGCLPVGSDPSPCSSSPRGFLSASVSAPSPEVSPRQKMEHGVEEQAIHVHSSDEEMRDIATEEEFDPRHSKAFGQPMVCRFEMSKRQFTDGFGLCSPGRWAPAAREKLANEQEAGHAKRLREIIGRFVDEKVKDVRKASFRLATGKLEEPPFKQDELDQLRREVAGALSDPAGALEVPPGQPFYLHLLAQSLKALGDPDWEVLTQGEECYANGMPLGCEKPMPRAPQVFAPRSKFRKLDETPFDPCMINYTSAELSADQLEAQFREDELAGRMVATTEGAVKQEYGEGQLLIAALGALVKPSGQIRPLHDGTHGIRLNNSIKVLDRLDHPGPADIVEVVARAADSGDAPFASART